VSNWKATGIIIIGATFAVSYSCRGENPRYAIIDTGHLGGNNTDARGLNNKGHVVGTSFNSAGDYHGYLWVNGTLTDLGVASGCCSNAREINEFGDIAGESTGSLNTIHLAALWPFDGDVFTLGAFDDDESSAYGINDLRQIVGGSHIVPLAMRAFLWEDGIMTNLGTLGGDYSLAWDINNVGEVVGASRGIDGRQNAFIWNDGLMAALPPLDMSLPFGNAMGINDSGLIVGESSVSVTRHHATMWINGVPYDLQQDPTASGSTGVRVNRVGDIVGSIYYNDEDAFACLWSGGEEIILKNVLPPKHKWTVLSYAWDINDQGMIVGEGKYPPYDGFLDSRGWVMVPVTPVCYLAGPSPGVAGTRNILRASGVKPGKKVYFVYGLQGGGSVIPGCDLAETLAAIQIENAKVIGSATANGQGIATLNTFVPDAARNAGDVLIQAVIPSECGISQLVVERFE